MSAQLSRCVAVYNRHFVASRINAPAVVAAVVFTLDHFVTTQTTMGGPNRYSTVVTSELQSRRLQFFRTVPWLPNLTFSNFITDEHTVCSYK